MKTFKPVKLNFNVDPGRYSVSQSGEILDTVSKEFVEPYVSTNGHNYAILETLDGSKCVDLIENIVASSYEIPIPVELIGRQLIVKHANGDTRDNNINNLTFAIDEEIFKDIGEIGYDDNLWYVSNHGAVYGRRYNKILKRKKSFSMNSRYFSLSGIRKKGTDKLNSLSIHRAVGLLFVEGRTENRNMINHIDGNTENNHYLNLEWVTNSENSLHARKLGLLKTSYGEDTAGAKISESTARKICELLLKSDGDICYVSSELNVPESTVKAIRNGFSWKNISCEYFENGHFRAHRYSRVMDVDTVRFICETLVKNNFDIDIVYDLIKDIPYMNREKVYRIKQKDSFRHISDEYF